MKKLFTFSFNVFMVFRDKLIIFVYSIKFYFLVFKFLTTKYFSDFRDFD